MKKLLLATAAVLGLAASAGAANAALVYTIWTGVGLNHSATFPVPTTDLLATFSDPGNPINFQDRAPNGSPNLFSSFFTPAVLAECNAANAACGGTAMSTADTGTDVNTVIRITGSYSDSAAFASTIDHDDGAAIYLDGAGNGAQLCGLPGEANENAEACPFPAGAHTFTILYTEDNGAPAILVTTLPVSTPEPTSLALIGVGLLGLGFVAARRRR